MNGEEKDMTLEAFARKVVVIARLKRRIGTLHGPALRRLEEFLQGAVDQLRSSEHYWEYFFAFFGDGSR